MSEKYYVIYTMGKAEIPGATSDKLFIKNREFATIGEARIYKDTVDPSRNPRIVREME